MKAEILRVPVSPELKRRFAKLEGQKRAVVAEVGALSAAQLNFRPGSGVWSVLDVVDHLIKVETGWLGAVRTELPDGKPVTLRDRVGAMVVNGVMRSPIRVRVPAGAEMVLPAPAVDREEAGARWDGVREEMVGLLSSLTPSQLRCGVFRHPVSGWMTVAGSLDFLSAHLRHHEYQLGRLRAGRARVDC